MQARKQRFVGKVRVVVEGLEHTTVSTLQDGEHEQGDFEASTNTSDGVVDVLVHDNGCWNRPAFQTLNKGGNLVGSREVDGGRVAAFRPGGRDSGSIALFYCTPRVLTASGKMIPT